MIFGSYSLSENIDYSREIGFIGNLNSDSELSFHQFNLKGISGGYMINSSLPLSSSDCLYNNENEGLLVLMSGTVYNRHELDKNCQLSEQCPEPELVANLFLEEGPGFVEKLNGDFSIFICSLHKKEAYLFRDHVGINPLAYNVISDTILFSSDINGLCLALKEPFDTEYLLGCFKYIDNIITPSKKISRLLPGHYLRFSESGIQLFKYWEPEKISEDKKLTYETMLSGLKTLLTDSVEIRCDKRFRAGSHVSGGIDSGIVAAIARKRYADQEDFYGFSWSPENYTPGTGIFDERELVRKSCKNAGIKPLFSDMDLKQFIGCIGNFYDHKAFFSEEKVLDQAKRTGTNLIFSGWGGDEFISTGDMGIYPDLLRGLRLRSFFRRNPLSNPGRLINVLLYFVLFPSIGIMDRATARSFRDEARYIRKPFNISNRKAIKDFYFYTTRHQMHLQLLRFYHLQDRCETWTINGFRKSVVYRYPLLDKRIIEFMLKVPSILLSRTDSSRMVLSELGEGVLDEDVRLNKNKDDPVYWSWMDDLFHEAACSFMDEIDTWRSNPDLHFIDFPLLEKDIQEFRSGSEQVKEKVLFRGMVFIKAIHEFTLKCQLQSGPA
jgi:asparagine synthase (glutamine-hydrolysing)